MTPAGWIAQLDRMLARAGTSVSISRAADGDAPSAQVDDVPATVRGYDAAALPAGINQAAVKIIVSPSALGGFEPRRGDFVTVAGETDRRIVLAVAPIRVGATVVRFEIAARG